MNAHICNVEEHIFNIAEHTCNTAALISLRKIPCHKKRKISNPLQ